MDKRKRVLSKKRGSVSQKSTLKTVIPKTHRKTVIKVPDGILVGISNKKNCKRVSFQKGGGVQYHGRISDIMFKIPINVKKTADKAFKMMERGFKGGQETGWKRAQQLSIQKSISIQDLRYIRNWFARHIHTSYPSYKKWEKAGKPLDNTNFYSKRGIIAWELWGGDAALVWVNKYTDKLNEYFDKKYTEISA